MIKILLVDDSQTQLDLMRTIIKTEPDMEVVGAAKNGKEAIEFTEKLKPDLIIMDIEMPVMDGLEATRCILANQPTPIIIMSSTINSQSSKSMYYIFDAGALASLKKLDSVFSTSFEIEKKHMIDVIRAMAEIKVAKRRFNIKKQNTVTENLLPINHHIEYEIIAMGVSVGGSITMKSILSKLPADYSLPIVVVQHMSHGFITGYADWLNTHTSLQVKDAEQHELLKKGTVYIAPDHFHFEIERKNGQLYVKLTKGGLVDGFCPSITVLLNSVAKTCGKKAIGMLLTGMGSDGAHGLLEMKNAQGYTIIQGPESAVVFGMGKVAQSLGAVDRVIELNHIPAYLIEIASSKKL